MLKNLFKICSYALWFKVILHILHLVLDINNIDDQLDATVTVY